MHSLNTPNMHETLSFTVLDLWYPDLAEDDRPVRRTPAPDLDKVLLDAEVDQLVVRQP